MKSLCGIAFFGCVLYHPLLAFFFILETYKIMFIRVMIHTIIAFFVLFHQCCSNYVFFVLL